MKKDKIILVEDDAVLRELTKDMLSMIEVDAYTAEDLDEAIDIFSKHHKEIAIAILDMNLDNATGVEVMEAMKKIDDSFVSVLASGMVTDVDIDEFKEMGFQEIIQKPYRMKTLQDIIHKYIEK